MEPRSPDRPEPTRALRRVMIGTAVCAAAGLLLAARAATAQIDRSVDEQGVIFITNSRSRKSSGSGTDRAENTPRPQAILPSGSGASRAHRYDEILREAAALYRLPEPYLRAVMKVESNFDPRVISPAGAVGLMQLMPFTAERMMVNDIFDPRQNIMGGARYLRILANAFNGDIHLTTAAYNAGEHAVVRYGGIPPYEETQNYVVKVLEHYEKYRAEASE